MTRYPTYDRFTPVFHLGHVDRVYEASVSATPKKIQYEHEGISESQKIRFYDVMATPNNKTFKFAVPLLRGMSDSITRGDLIMYCVIGTKTFYLGPINTKNTPSNSADNTYNPKAYGKKANDKPSGYNKNIPSISIPPLAKVRNKSMDFIGTNLTEYQDVIQEYSGDYDDSIYTDFTLEGRYGNSIRLGARDKFPYTIISNNREGEIEKIDNSTSFIGMTSIGAISDNFLLNGTYRLSCEQKENMINIGNDVVIPEVPENTFNYGYNNDALLFKEKPKAQIIISSDRIIFDSMDEDITISSNRNINLGANKNFTLTNKGFSVFETKNIYIGKEAKNRTQPMVLGEQLRNLLVRILRLLADAQALGDMNVPQALTLFPNIHDSGTLRTEVESIMKEFNLGKLEPGVNPPSPDPAILLNVEEDVDGNKIPVGDRISGQPTFLSQYHFIEENIRPEPQAETA